MDANYLLVFGKLKQVFTFELHTSIYGHLMAIHTPYHGKESESQRSATQQFDRPHVGDCKIRNQSRMRADNKMCAYGYM